ncbi:MAG: hypothetical protein RIQ59_189 [Bacteroidota bacterium]|jgi:hypothetical protein
MEDFSRFTVIPENFVYEEVLAKNHSYKTENKNLKNLLFALGIFVLGASIYLINEELNKKTRSI